MKRIGYLLITFIAGLTLLSTGEGTNQSDDIKKIKTEIFTVIYSQKLQQPMELTYWVQCPGDGVSRKGLDFYEVDGITTSDDDDYYNNPWDKGHLAPAADFNCDREMLKKTFSYLNCALQHEGLNRGPWRLLESYERELALVNDTVWVNITVHFETDSVLPTGAKIPSGFTKTITYGDNIEEYRFPNVDVRREDWRNFRVVGK